jgi:hypothetical protein
MKELYRLFAYIWVISAIALIGITVFVGSPINPFVLIISSTFTAVFAVIYYLTQESKSLRP